MTNGCMLLSNQEDHQLKDPLELIWWEQFEIRNISFQLLSFVFISIIVKSGALKLLLTQE